MAFAGGIDREAEKAAVFVARLLWAMTRLARALKNRDCGMAAESCKRFLLDHLRDPDQGGIFWSAAHDGGPGETRKQIFAQTYGVYALAGHAGAAGDEEARAAALALFHVMERRMRRDDRLYAEDCRRDWTPAAPRRRRFRRAAPAAQSMPAYLHLIMSYSELAAATGDGAVRARLKALVETFLDCFVTPAGHCHMALDEHFTGPAGAGMSWGHDLEAAWILDRAGDLIGEPGLATRCRVAARGIVQAACARAQQDDGGWTDRFDAAGRAEPWRNWWTQTEAINALVNEAACSPGDTAQMLARAARTWDFIEANLLDRDGGGWFDRVDAGGGPDETRPRVGPWTEAYHQVRCCLRLVEFAAHARAR